MSFDMRTPQGPRLQFDYQDAADTGAGTNDPPKLTVTVRDNGIGMSESAQYGLGLLCIKERIIGMGGTLKIE
jgi:glucose-6-phosphate-specific signal transduction histidine kinase